MSHKSVGRGIKTSSVIKCFHSSHTSHFIAKCWKKTNGIVYCCTKVTHSFYVKAGPLHPESNGHTDVSPVLCNSLAACRVLLNRQADRGWALFLPLRTNAHQLASPSQGAGCTLSSAPVSLGRAVLTQVPARVPDPSAGHATRKGLCRTSVAPKDHREAQARRDTGVWLVSGHTLSGAMGKWVGMAMFQ